MKMKLKILLWLGERMKKRVYFLVGLSLFLTSAGCKRKTAYFSEQTLVIRVDQSGVCFVDSQPLDTDALKARVVEYIEDERLLGKDLDRIEVLLDLEPTVLYSKAQPVERLIKGSGAQMRLLREKEGRTDPAMQPKTLVDIKEEFSRMVDPPEVSILAVDRVLRQRLWMKANGQLYLDSTLIDEKALVGHAGERCYLYLMGEDVLNYLEKGAYDIHCFSMIVEPGALYRDVHRIEQVIALTPCSLKITVLRDDLDFLQKPSAEN